MMTTTTNDDGSKKDARALRGRARKLHRTRKALKNGKTLAMVHAERKAQRERRRSRAVTSREAQSVVKKIDECLSVLEREVLRLANVERADPHEIAATLNASQETTGWTVERVGDVLERARGKLTKAGELEASRPSAYAAQDARLRYDSIIKGLREELSRIMPSPMFALTRAKALKTIAEVERMRDDALAALTGSASPIAAAGAFVYVSHLRDGASPPVIATAATAGARAGRGPTPPTPPPPAK